VTRLTENLTANLPPGGTGDTGLNSITPAIVAALPGPVREIIVNAYNDALTPIFLWMVPLVLVAGVLLAFVQEKPLATRIEQPEGELTLNMELLDESLSIGANPTAEPVLTVHSGTIRVADQGSGSRRA
jgi:hypothetical protein